MLTQADGRKLKDQPPMCTNVLKRVFSRPQTHFPLQQETYGMDYNLRNIIFEELRCSCCVSLSNIAIYRKNLHVYNVNFTDYSRAAFQHILHRLKVHTWIIVRTLMRVCTIMRILGIHVEYMISVNCCRGIALSANVRLNLLRYHRLLTSLKLMKSLTIIQQSMVYFARAALLALPCELEYLAAHESGFGVIHRKMMLFSRTNSR